MNKRILVTIGACTTIGGLVYLGYRLYKHRKYIKENTITGRDIAESMGDLSEEVPEEIVRYMEIESIKGESINELLSGEEPTEDVDMIDIEYRLTVTEEVSPDDDLLAAIENMEGNMKHFRDTTGSEAYHYYVMTNMSNYSEASIAYKLLHDLFYEPWYAKTPRDESIEEYLELTRINFEFHQKNIEEPVSWGELIHYYFTRTHNEFDIEYNDLLSILERLGNIPVKTVVANLTAGNVSIFDMPRYNMFFESDSIAEQYDEFISFIADNNIFDWDEEDQ